MLNLCFHIINGLDIQCDRLAGQRFDDDLLSTAQTILLGCCSRKESGRPPTVFQKRAIAGVPEGTPLVLTLCFHIVNSIAGIDIQ